MKKRKSQVKKLKIGKETLLALQTKKVVGGVRWTALPNLVEGCPGTGLK